MLAEIPASERDTTSVTCVLSLVTESAGSDNYEADDATEMPVASEAVVDV